MDSMPLEITRTVAPPTTRKNRKSTMVATMPRLARRLMPVSTPEVAETRNSAVTTTMITTATLLDLGTSNRCSRPLLSWSPLSPRAVAVPNSVATMARACTIGPSGFVDALGRAAV
jgi:hypothetical protein